MQVPGAREVAVNFFRNVQELQHGAHRLHGRQQGPGLRAVHVEGYHDYGTFTPIQVASILELEPPMSSRRLR